MSEFRSQVIEQAHRLGRTLTKAEVIAVNGEYAAWANKEITSLRQQLEQAEARVAELEDFVADTAIACQRSLDPDWVPDGVQEALVPLYRRCHELLGDDPDEYESAWLFRKQAEAVEAAHELVSSADSIREMARACSDYAQRLRQQAAEIEKAGGEQ